MLSQQHHPISHSILFIPIANACCEQNLLFVHPDHLCFDRTTYDNINGPAGPLMYPDQIFCDRPREATVFYRRLADLLSRKSNMVYGTTLAWIRCTLSFSLLRSVAMCIRGSRSRISYRRIHRCLPGGGSGLESQGLLTP